MDEASKSGNPFILDAQFLNTYQMLPLVPTLLSSDGNRGANSGTNYSDEENLEIADISYTSSNILKCNETLPQLEEIELRALLSQWGQDYLAEELIAQGVYVSSLRIMKRHHIERLLKKFNMGQQILFEHNLELWRQSIGNPLSSSSDALSNQSSATSSRSVSRASTPTHGLRFAPYEKSSTLVDHADDTRSMAISLATILNGSPRGSMLVEYYNKFGNFQEDQRFALITLIAQTFQEKQIKMTLAASYQIEKEILERFPSEKLEYYRTSKRGKIYIKYCNLVTSFKVVSKNLIEKKQKKENNETKSRHDANVLEPEMDAESCARALKFDNLTADQFDSTWKACFRFRLQCIKSKNTVEIMEKWPFYKSPSGYRLIDMDFKSAFENRDGLLCEWDDKWEKFLSFLMAENHIKDRNVKVILESLKNNTAISENGRNAALVWALHGYLVPTSKIIKKDPATGKKATTKFTIKDSQESVVFLGATQQEVEDHISHLKRTNTSIQPSIYAIGENIFSIEQIFVMFDDIRYKFANFLRALDICFKIMYLFDLEFPRESTMFYCFLETYFYKLTPSNKYAKVTELSEYLSKD